MHAIHFNVCTPSLHAARMLSVLNAYISLQDVLNILFSVQLVLAG